MATITLPSEVLPGAVARGLRRPRYLARLPILASSGPVILGVTVAVSVAVLAVLLPKA